MLAPARQGPGGSLQRVPDPRQGPVRRSARWTRIRHGGRPVGGPRERPRRRRVASTCPRASTPMPILPASRRRRSGAFPSAMPRPHSFAAAPRRLPRPRGRRPSPRHPANAAASPPVGLPHVIPARTRRRVVGPHLVAEHAATCGAGGRAGEVRRGGGGGGGGGGRRLPRGGGRRRRRRRRQSPQQPRRAHPCARAARAISPRRGRTGGVRLVCGRGLRRPPPRTSRSPAPADLDARPLNASFGKFYGLPPRPSPRLRRVGATPL